MQKLTYYIYGLKCPIEKRIKYVGITKSIKTRFAGHLRDKTNTGKGIWIQTLKSKNLLPILKVLNTVHTSREDALHEERKFIYKYRKTIFNVVNVLSWAQIRQQHLTPYHSIKQTKQN